MPSCWNLASLRILQKLLELLKHQPAVSANPALQTEDTVPLTRSALAKASRIQHPRAEDRPGDNIDVMLRAVAPAIQRYVSLPRLMFTRWPPPVFWRTRVFGDLNSSMAASNRARTASQEYCCSTYLLPAAPKESRSCLEGTNLSTTAANSARLEKYRPPFEERTCSRVTAHCS